MISHGHVAIGALDHITAAAAADEGIVSAPVHQQHGLLPLLHAGTQPAHQRAGEDRAVALLQLPAHIDDLDRRHRTIVYAVRHFQQRQVTTPSPGERQDARCCTGQQERRALRFAAPLGNLSRIVPRVMVAQISCLVLLINDDQPQLFQRCKHSRSCADHNTRISPADSPPLVKPFACGQP